MLKPLRFGRWPIALMILPLELAVGLPETLAQQEAFIRQPGPFLAASRCAEIGMPRIARGDVEVNYSELIGSFAAHWAPFCTALWVDEYAATVDHGSMSLVEFLFRKEAAMFTSPLQNNVPASANSITPELSESSKSSIRERFRHILRVIESQLCAKGDVQPSFCREFFQNVNIAFCSNHLPLAQQDPNCGNLTEMTQKFNFEIRGVPIIPIIWPANWDGYANDEELVRWLSGGIRTNSHLIVRSDLAPNANRTLFDMVLTHEFSHLISRYYIDAVANNRMTTPTNVHEIARAIKVTFDFGTQRLQQSPHVRNWYRSLFQRFHGTDETFSCFSEFIRNGAAENSIRHGSVTSWIYYEEAFANFLSVELPVLFPDLNLPRSFTADQISSQCDYMVGSHDHPAGHELMTCLARSPYVRSMIMERTGCRF